MNIRTTLTLHFCIYSMQHNSRSLFFHCSAQLLGGADTLGGALGQHKPFMSDSVLYENDSLLSWAIYQSIFPLLRIFTRNIRNPGDSMKWTPEIRLVSLFGICDRFITTLHVVIYFRIAIDFCLFISHRSFEIIFSHLIFIRGNTSARDGIRKIIRFSIWKIGKIVTSI